MSAIDKVIEVRVKHGPDMDIEDFHPFQGDLKALPKENYEKLKHTILEEGFADPFNLYFDADKKKYFICDGHQRQLVLKGLRAEGYMVPKVPTNIVLARSFEQAKKFVLTFASNYGVLSEESLSNYMIDAGLDLDFLNASVVMPEVSVDYFSAEYGDSSPVDLDTHQGDEKYNITIKCDSIEEYQALNEKLDLNGNSSISYSNFIEAIT